MGPKYLSELGHVLIEMSLIVRIVGGFFSLHWLSLDFKSQLKQQRKCYCLQQPMRGSRPWT